MPCLHIWKIGGRVLDDPTMLTALLQAFSNLPTPKLLVHGGGDQASELSSRLGITPQKVQGRRITDQATLEVVTMVYAGLLNKKLVAGLQALGVNALGLTGADADIIRARKREVKEVDYGYAGDIFFREGSEQPLSDFLNMGLTPVVCALTHDGQGQLLNTNADTIAAHLGQTLSQEFEVKLAYCFDKPGVLLDTNNPQSVVPELNPELYQKLKNQGKIADGMIPKLDNAFAALDAGVQEILLGDWQGITSTKPNGTRLCMK